MTAASFSIMRATSDRSDVRVIHADKLLLRIAVRRTLGVAQKNYSKLRSSSLIDALGVSYVVAQPNFWTDLEQMRRFQNVLNSSHFVIARRFRMNANYGHERELVVYRNLGKFATGPIKIVNDLPIIDRVIAGAGSAYVRRPTPSGRQSVP